MYDVYTTLKQRGQRSEFDIERKTNSKPESPQIKENATALPDDKPSSPESKQQADLLAKFDSKSEVNFEDIMSSLNGFARIVKYRSCPAPGSFTNPRFIDKQELEVLSIEEGVYRSGKKSGYCRVLNGETGQAECGFFKNDLPSGKYVKWGDDQIEVLEGIYKGRSLASSIGIKSFIFNVETNY